MNSQEEDILDPLAMTPIKINKSQKNRSSKKKSIIPIKKISSIEIQKEEEKS